jgi:MFS family permease
MMTEAGFRPVVRRASVGMLCWLTCLVVLGALFPSYPTDFLHLGIAKMRFVLSAIGFSGALGALTMPALTDRLGRKPVMILSVIAAFLFLLCSRPVTRIR